MAALLSPATETMAYSSPATCGSNRINLVRAKTSVVLWSYLPKASLSDGTNPVQRHLLFDDSLPISPSAQNSRSDSQTSLHIRLDNLLILLSSLPPHLRGLHIRRTLIIWLSQHTHNTDENLLHALYRRPTFGCMLIMIRIITWRV